MEGNSAAITAAGTAAAATIWLPIRLQRRQNKRRCGGNSSPIVIAFFHGKKRRSREREEESISHLDDECACERHNRIAAYGARIGLVCTPYEV